MNRTLVLTIALILFAVCALASEEKSGNEKEQLKAVAANLLEDNAKFVETHNSKYFEPFVSEQHPRATIVMCSDSRVHIHAMDQTPDSDLFMVRNIGNQLATAEGSVEYGVHHLHTPLLIFIGHSGCGAIEAALGDYSRESSAIKQELDTIKIAKGVSNMDGVLTNLNNQVAEAMKKFEKEVREGKLTVAAAVYDFRNDLKQAHGRLVIVNVNGETSVAKIRQSELIKRTER